jgi:phosphoglucosamine mutase
MCDEKGHIIDGDRILAFLATHLKSQGNLAHNTVVATVMSNLGLEQYLTSQDIKLLRTKVGDRYVSSTMTEGGYNLGGEQSGHVIFSDYSPSGDGLLTALHVLAFFCDTDKLASEALQPYSPLPQVLKNVSMDTRKLNDTSTQKLIKEREDRISQQNGRLLVRASGTEPLVRVMAEGEDTTTVEAFVDELVEELKKV